MSAARLVVASLKAEAQKGLVSLASALEAIDAAVAEALAASVGSRVVPVEPTDEMLSCGKREAHRNNGARDKALRMYRAMLAAAPSTTAAAPVQETLTPLARRVIQQRDTYGWSVECDEAINAMRLSLASPSPAAPMQELPSGPVLHGPSGFVFDEVLAAADVGALVALTPQSAAAPSPVAPVLPAGDELPSERRVAFLNWWHEHSQNLWITPECAEYVFEAGRATLSKQVPAGDAVAQLALVRRIVDRLSDSPLSLIDNLREALCMPEWDHDKHALSQSGRTGEKA